MLVITATVVVRVSVFKVIVNLKKRERGESKLRHHKAQCSYHDPADFLEQMLLKLCNSVISRVLNIFILTIFVSVLVAFLEGGRDC